MNFKNTFELIETFKKRALKPSEWMRYTFEKIKEKGAKFNIFISIYPERAKKLAKEADIRYIKGTNRILEGIPVVVKDNICVKGMLTTCGSHILENFISPYNATVVDKLISAGAIIIGKSNMDEFAMGSSNETSYFGPVLNPVDERYVPGGSSGGSAAAVAANIVHLALGTDTGGSIRLPASFCGVVGLKPTYGRVSRYGLVAYASSLDQIGPITQTVEDAALLLKIISGKDPYDSTSVNIEVKDYVKELELPVKGLKIGLPKEYFNEGLSYEVANVISKTKELLQNMGVNFIEVSLPHTKYAIACYYLIATAEASSNLARYDGVRYGFRFDEKEIDLAEMYEATRSLGFGKEVKRRIMLGTYALSSGYYDQYYLKAQKVRTLIKNEMLQALKECDALLTPTSPTPPFKIGEKISDPLQMYLSDIFTVTANLAGLPAISVPAGRTEQGLPIGVQIIGNFFQEDIILRIAKAILQEGGFK